LKRERRLKLKDESRKRKLEAAGISYELPVRYFNFQTKKIQKFESQENDPNTENQTDEISPENIENQTDEISPENQDEEFEIQENQPQEKEEGELEGENSSHEGEMEDPK